MPVDAYSLCPGGSGKKIKFCCPDMLGDLQKIERMIEGEQNLACLGLIERLQQQEPDRACLMAIKGIVLRVMGRADEALANATAMVQKHPDNPVALAESAIVTAAEDGLAALATLQRALAACNGQIQSRVYEAIGVVARSLLDQGQWLAPRALLHLQAAVSPDDRRSVETLLELNAIADVPLMLKYDLPDPPCPDNAPWKNALDEAMAPSSVGDWRTAADRLAVLAEQFPDASAIWRNLAMLRGRHADNDGCIAALERLAATEIPLEDAVEAEALAMFLADVPLGDPVELFSATFPVKDADRLQAALATESRVMHRSPDSSSINDDDSPPPRATYLFFDRGLPEGGEDATLANVSVYLGGALLYGRQTDREARLDLDGVTADGLRQIRELLAEVAGDSVDLESAKEESVGHTSASLQLMRHDWRLPRHTSREQFEALATAHVREAMLERWPRLALGVLGGKSPSEVAGDESFRRKLLAAVMVLQSWVDPVQTPFDFNELRSQLGLPILELIDPGATDLRSLPPVRLSRVMVESASDEALCDGFFAAAFHGAEEAQVKFAREVVLRDSLAGGEVGLSAYRILAEAERDSDKALECVERGRAISVSAGESCATWDLMELSHRTARREGAHVSRLMQHLQDRHIDEPGVAEAITRFLVSIGAVRPDGTPGGPSRHPAASEDAAPQGSIWTPGARQPGGEKKIWTPD